MNRFLSRAIFLFLASNVLFMPHGHAAEEAPKETGVWIERADGRFLKLLIEENHLQVHFTDKEKEAIEPDASRASARLESRINDSRETMTLQLEEGEKVSYLTSARFIRPPYQYRLTLILMLNGEENTTETHTLFFQQAEVEIGDDPS